MCVVIYVFHVYLVCVIKPRVLKLVWMRTRSTLKSLKQIKAAVAGRLPDATTVSADQEQSWGLAPDSAQSGLKQFQKKLVGGMGYHHAGTPFCCIPCLLLLPPQCVCICVRLTDLGWHMLL